MWRVTMDELEFLKAYNDAVSAAEKITAPETKTAMMLVLQIIDALAERITELQTDEEEDEPEDE
jgi:hypothetical protein